MCLASPECVFYVHQGFVFVWNSSHTDHRRVSSLQCEFSCLLVSFYCENLLALITCIWLSSIPPREGQDLVWMRSSFHTEGKWNIFWCLFSLVSRIFLQFWPDASLPTSVSSSISYFTSNRTKKKKITNESKKVQRVRKCDFHKNK